MKYLISSIMLLFALCAAPIHVNAAVEEGQTAPDFKAEHWENSGHITFKDLSGKTAILWFWAPWSTACEKVAPYINALYMRYRQKDVEFIGLTKEKDTERVVSFIKKFNIAFPVGAKSSAHTSYNIHSVPWIVVISKGRHIEWEGNPDNPEFQLTLKRIVDKVKIKDKDDPPEPDKNEDAVSFLKKAKRNVGRLCSGEQPPKYFFTTLRSYISSNPDPQIEKYALAVLAELIMRGQDIEVQNEAVKFVAMFKHSKMGVNVFGKALYFYGRKDLTSIKAKPYKQLLINMADAMPKCGKYDPNAASLLHKFILSPQFKIDMEVRSHALKAMATIRTAASIELLINIFPRIKAYPWDTLRDDMFNSLYAITGINRNDQYSGIQNHDRYSDWRRWWMKNKRTYQEKFLEEMKKELKSDK